MADLTNLLLGSEVDDANIQDAVELLGSQGPGEVEKQLLIGFALRKELRDGHCNEDVIALSEEFLPLGCTVECSDGFSLLTAVRIQAAIQLLGRDPPDWEGCDELLEECGLLPCGQADGPVCRFADAIKGAHAAYAAPEPSRIPLDSLLAAYPLGPVLETALTAVQIIIAKLQEQLRSENYPERMDQECRDEENCSLHANSSQPVGSTGHNSCRGIKSDPWDSHHQVLSMPLSDTQCTVIPETQADSHPTASLPNPEAHQQGSGGVDQLPEDARWVSGQAHRSPTRPKESEAREGGVFDSGEEFSSPIRALSGAAEGSPVPLEEGAQGAKDTMSTVDNTATEGRGVSGLRKEEVAADGGEEHVCTAAHTAGAPVNVRGVTGDSGLYGRSVGLAVPVMRGIHEGVPTTRPFHGLLQPRNIAALHAADEGVASELLVQHYPHTTEQCRPSMPTKAAEQAQLREDLKLNPSAGMSERGEAAETEPAVMGEGIAGGLHEGEEAVGRGVFVRREGAGVHEGEGAAGKELLLRGESSAGACEGEEAAVKLAHLRGESSAGACEGEEAAVKEAHLREEAAAGPCQGEETDGRQLWLREEARRKVAVDDSTGPVPGTREKLALTSPVHEASPQRAGALPGESQGPAINDAAEGRAGSPSSPMPRGRGLQHEYSGAGPETPQCLMADDPDAALSAILGFLPSADDVSLRARAQPRFWEGFQNDPLMERTAHQSEPCGSSCGLGFATSTKVGNAQCSAPLPPALKLGASKPAVVSAAALHEQVRSGDANAVDGAPCLESFPMGVSPVADMELSPSDPFMSCPPTECESLPEKAPNTDLERASSDSFRSCSPTEVQSQQDVAPVADLELALSNALVSCPPTESQSQPDMPASPPGMTLPPSGEVKLGPSLASSSPPPAGIAEPVRSSEHSGDSPSGKGVFATSLSPQPEDISELAGSREEAGVSPSGEEVFGTALEACSPPPSLLGPLPTASPAGTSEAVNNPAQAHEAQSAAGAATSLSRGAACDGEMMGKPSEALDQPPGGKVGAGGASDRVEDFSHAATPVEGLVPGGHPGFRAADVSHSSAGAVQSGRNPAGERERGPSPERPSVPPNVEPCVASDRVRIPPLGAASKCGDPHREGEPAPSVERRSMRSHRELSPPVPSEGVNDGAALQGFLATAQVTSRPETQEKEVFSTCAEGSASPNDGATSDEFGSPCSNSGPEQAASPNATPPTEAAFFSVPPPYGATSRNTPPPNEAASPNAPPPNDAASPNAPPPGEAASANALPPNEAAITSTCEAGPSASGWDGEQQADRAASNGVGETQESDEVAGLTRSATSSAQRGAGPPQPHAPPGITVADTGDQAISNLHGSADQVSADEGQGDSPGILDHLRESANQGHSNSPETGQREPPLREGLGETPPRDSPQQGTVPPPTLQVSDRTTPSTSHHGAPKTRAGQHVPQPADRVPPPSPRGLTQMSRPAAQKAAGTADTHSGTRRSQDIESQVVSKAQGPSANPEFESLLESDLQPRPEETSQSTPHPIGRRPLKRPRAEETSQSLSLTHHIVTSHCSSPERGSVVVTSSPEDVVDEAGSSPALVQPPGPQLYVLHKPAVKARPRHHSRPNALAASSRAQVEHQGSDQLRQGILDPARGESEEGTAARGGAAASVQGIQGNEEAGGTAVGTTRSNRPLANEHGGWERDQAGAGKVDAMGANRATDRQQGAGKSDAGTRGNRAGTDDRGAASDQGTSRAPVFSLIDWGLQARAASKRASEGHGPRASGGIQAGGTQQTAGAGTSGLFGSSGGGLWSLLGNLPMPASGPAQSNQIRQPVQPGTLESLPRPVEAQKHASQPGAGGESAPPKTTVPQHSPTQTRHVPQSGITLEVLQRGNPRPRLQPGVSRQSCLLSLIEKPLRAGSVDKRLIEKPPGAGSGDIGRETAITPQERSLTELTAPCQQREPSRVGLHSSNPAAKQGTAPASLAESATVGSPLLPGDACHGRQGEKQPAAQPSTNFLHDTGMHPPKGVEKRLAANLQQRSSRRAVPDVQSCTAQCVNAPEESAVGNHRNAESSATSGPQNPAHLQAHMGGLAVGSEQVGATGTQHSARRSEDITTQRSRGLHQADTAAQQSHGRHQADVAAGGPDTSMAPPAVPLSPQVSLLSLFYPVSNSSPLRDLLPGPKPTGPPHRTPSPSGSVAATGAQGLHANLEGCERASHPASRGNTASVHERVGGQAAAKCPQKDPPTMSSWGPLGSMCREIMHDVASRAHSKSPRQAAMGRADHGSVQSGHEGQAPRTSACREVMHDVASRERREPPLQATMGRADHGSVQRGREGEAARTSAEQSPEPERGLPVAANAARKRRRSVRLEGSGDGQGAHLVPDGAETQLPGGNEDGVGQGTGQLLREEVPSRKRPREADADEEERPMKGQRVAVTEGHSERRPPVMKMKDVIASEMQNPGALQIPWLVPKAYRRANQKAAAAIRALAQARGGAPPAATCAPCARATASDPGVRRAIPPPMRVSALVHTSTQPPALHATSADPSPHPGLTGTHKEPAALHPNSADSSRNPGLSGAPSQRPMGPPTAPPALQHASANAQFAAPPSAFARTQPITRDAASANAQPSAPPRTQPATGDATSAGPPTHSAATPQPSLLAPTLPTAQPPTLPTTTGAPEHAPLIPAFPPRRSASQHRAPPPHQSPPPPPCPQAPAVRSSNPCNGAAAPVTGQQGVAGQGMMAGSAYAQRQVEVCGVSDPRLGVPYRAPSSHAVRQGADTLDQPLSAQWGGRAQFGLREAIAGDIRRLFRTPTGVSFTPLNLAPLDASRPPTGAPQLADHNLTGVPFTPRNPTSLEAQRPGRISAQGTEHSVVGIPFTPRISTFIGFQHPQTDPGQHGAQQWSGVPFLPRNPPPTHALPSVELPGPLPPVHQPQVPPSSGTWTPAAYPAQQRDAHALQGAGPSLRTPARAQPQSTWFETPAPARLAEQNYRAAYANQSIAGTPATGHVSLGPGVQVQGTSRMPGPGPPLPPAAGDLPEGAGDIVWGVPVDAATAQGLVHPAPGPSLTADPRTPAPRRISETNPWSELARASRSPFLPLQKTPGPRVIAQPLGVGPMWKQATTSTHPPSRTGLAHGDAQQPWRGQEERQAREDLGARVMGQQEVGSGGRGGDYPDPQAPGELLGTGANSVYTREGFGGGGFATQWGAFGRLASALPTTKGWPGSAVANPAVNSTGPRPFEACTPVPQGRIYGPAQGQGVFQQAVGGASDDLGLGCCAALADHLPQDAPRYASHEHAAQGLDVPTGRLDGTLHNANHKHAVRGVDVPAGGFDGVSVRSRTDGEEAMASGLALGREPQRSGGRGLRESERDDAHEPFMRRSKRRQRWKAVLGALEAHLADDVDSDSS